MGVSDGFYSVAVQAGLWGWETRRRKLGYERSGLGLELVREHVIALR